MDDKISVKFNSFRFNVKSVVCVCCKSTYVSMSICKVEYPSTKVC